MQSEGIEEFHWHIQIDMKEGEFVIEIDEEAGTLYVFEHEYEFIFRQFSDYVVNIERKADGIKYEFFRGKEYLHNIYSLKLTDLV